MVSLHVHILSQSSRLNGNSKIFVLNRKKSKIVIAKSTFFLLDRHTIVATVEFLPVLRIACDVGCQFTILNATFEIAFTLRVSHAVTFIKFALVFLSAAFN